MRFLFSFSFSIRSWHILTLHFQKIQRSTFCKIGCVILKILSHKYKGTITGWSSKFVYLVKLQDSPSIITLPKIPLPLTYTSPPLLHLMGLLQPYQISKLNFTIFLVAVLACMIQHLNNSSTLEISWQALLQSGTTPRLIPPLSTFPHPGTSRHFWPP